MCVCVYIYIYIYIYIYVCMCVSVCVCMYAWRGRWGGGSVSVLYTCEFSHLSFFLFSIEEEEKESGEQTKGIQKQGKPEEKLTDPREDKEKAEYTDSERSGEQGQVFARGGNGHRAHSLPARSSNSTASGDINVHSMQAGDGGRCRIHSEPESDNCAVPDDDFNVHDKQAGGGSAGDAWRVYTQHCV